jgi:mannose-6-phosphate isomerase-like protein (cupin superfamily)
MRSITALVAFLLLVALAHGQKVAISDLSAPDKIDQIAKSPLFSDPHTTSVLLWINGEVKLHKHATHSEHVVVLSGKAEMRLGEETFTVRKGDVIFIPEGTPHAVKVRKGVLKVISIQSPQFDGTDRVPLE